MERYRHTQIGVPILVFDQLATLALVLLIVFKGFDWSIVAALAIVSLVTVNLIALTVTIDEETLRIRFGVGLIRKAWALRDIAECRSVTNRWFTGWGVRFTPHGTVYSVAGAQAVEIRLRDGKTPRIGTNDAEGLVNAIREAINDKGRNV